MDPYCKISLGAELKKSKTHQEAGKYPTWNDVFTFQRNMENCLNIEVWDEDTISSDDLVGETSISLSEVFEKKRLQNWYVLSYKGKEAGKILVSLEWQPDEINRQTPSRSVPTMNYSYSPNTIPMMGSPPMYNTGYPPQMAYGPTYGGSPYNSAPGFQRTPTVAGPPPVYGTQYPQQYPGYPPTNSPYQTQAPLNQPPYQQPNPYQSQPPTGQYPQPPTGQYQGGQYQAPPGGQYQAPPGGYQQPPGQYQQPPGQYQQPPGGQYQQPPTGPAGGLYQQPPGGQYQQPPSGQYQQQPGPGGQYQQQPGPGGQYQQPPGGQLQQPSPGQYGAPGGQGQVYPTGQQQPPAGYMQGNQTGTGGEYPQNQPPGQQQFGGQSPGGFPYKMMQTVNFEETNKQFTHQPTVQQQGGYQQGYPYGGNDPNKQFTHQPTTQQQGYQQGGGYDYPKV